MLIQNRVLLVTMLCCFGSTSLASIVDLTTWTPVEDPPDANFTASQNATSATLRATGGPILPTRDIGFQSVNGLTPGSSTSGHSFDPLFDFSIAIDYSLSLVNPQGVLGLGFGIGEDGNGANSAGVALATVNGLFLAPFGGAARVNNMDEPMLTLGSLPATSSGSLFLQYEAASGDVTVGANPGLSAGAPSVSDTFAGIQNRWNDQDLLVSFFIRSDDIGWASGEAEATFTNFRVLSGSPTAVPEPSSVTGLSLLCLGFTRSIRRSRRKRNGTLH